MGPVTVLELRQPQGGRIDLWTVARKVERRVRELGGPSASSRRPPVMGIDPPTSYPIRWLGDQEVFVRVAFHDVAVALPPDQVPVAVLTTPDAERAPLAQEEPQAAPVPTVAAPVRLTLPAEQEAVLRELAAILEERRAPA